MDDKRGRPAHVLLFPLPLEPLPEPYLDPLPLALAFAATRIPVIIPSGNKGTSSLSYPAGSDGRVEDLASLDRLAHLFDLDLASVRAVFGAVESDEQSSKESDQQTPETRDQKILGDLISSLRDRAPIIWVGACNDQGRRSRYSQYGAGLTLVAPSDDVLPSPQEVENGARHPPSIATTDLKGIGGYMQDQSHYTLSDNEFGFGGTSAAAAQVAGVVALMLEANSDLGPTDVYRILCDTARVRDEQKNDLLLTDDGSTPEQLSPEFGHGLADAAGAVAAARKEQRGAA
jgi:subtilisin family serine protease